MFAVQQAKFGVHEKQYSNPMQTVHRMVAPVTLSMAGVYCCFRLEGNPKDLRDNVDVFVNQQVAHAVLW
jgi:hypothetical protein